jgi:2-iminoacetate synthase
LVINALSFQGRSFRVEAVLEILKKTIPKLLEEKRIPSSTCIREILQAAKERALAPPGGEYVQGLTLEEAALLLSIDGEKTPEIFQELIDTALWVKRAIYGNRIVLFAPLYVSNLCSSSCLYCGYRAKNRALPRKVLSDEELNQEVETLEKQGHKRLLMLCGDHPSYTFHDFLHAVEVASSVKTEPHGEIRRINVEIPALKIEEFKELKATGKIGTYALFQETYHKQTYEKMHPYGPKSDYLWRLFTMDRALQGGVDDVGIGALFGLYDYRYEVLGLLAHAKYLDKKYSVGPHTISVPRLQRAANTPFTYDPPYAVCDKDFEKIVAILRLAVPYTGIILTTRESPEMRRKLYHIGVSQISAGSRTKPGGYSREEERTTSQFSLSDTRPTNEVIKELAQLGFIPSWCTACYRLCRTGEAFMNIAKRGEIQQFCQPNALLTFAEYLHDYADAPLYDEGMKLIDREAKKIGEGSRKEAFLRYLMRIKKGERDFYF